MIKSKRVKKLVVSLLLAISILSCSFSVYAVEGTAPPVGDNWLLVSNDETAAFLVWQLLQSWGIDVQYQNISQWTGDVQDLVQNWIYDFLGDQPSIESVGAWIADWLFGTDFWGNLVVNNTLLEDVQAFADWLLDKYDLSSNEDIVVNPVYSVGGYTFYQFGISYAVNQSIAENPFEAIKFSLEQGNASGYMIFKNTDMDDRPNSQWGFVLLSNLNYSSVRLRMQIRENGSFNNGTLVNFSHPSVSSNGWYYERNQGLIYRQGVPEGRYFEGSGSELIEFLRNVTVTMEGNIKIVTSLINLPDDDIGYSPGDSMTIIDGEPDYSVVDWDGTVNVGNLPAIVSTGRIENPEIDQIYTNIPPLVEEAGDSMEIMRQIIFRMPDGVLIALYAMLSAGVIFGILRIMREH